VLAWRADQHLLACLRTLAASEGVAFETVILLNGATPQVIAAVRDHVQGARVLESSVNLGFGGGCNRAARAARGRYLVFLNDDTEVPSDWLRHLVAAAEQDGVAAVSSRLVFPDGRLQEAGCLLWADGSTWQVGWGTPDGDECYDEPRDVPFGSAAGLLVRRAAFAAIGGYSLAYHPAYFEDADLCLRLWQDGGRVRYAPNARLVHAQSASSTLDFRTWLYEQHQVIFRDRWSHVLQPAPAEPEILDGAPITDAIAGQAAVIEAARRANAPEPGGLDHSSLPALPDWDEDELRAMSFEASQLRRYADDLQTRFAELSAHCHQIALERDRLDTELREVGGHAHALNERLDAVDRELRATNELTDRLHEEIAQLRNPGVREAARLVGRAVKATGSRPPQ
ncbi:MAG TPA: glycosyltransferase, partial [Mycobacteriales bacterium]|nr:glycosyltransferase [Mycobacteriales bacterium]